MVISPPLFVITNEAVDVPTPAQVPTALKDGGGGGGGTHKDMSAFVVSEASFELANV